MQDVLINNIKSIRTKNYAEKKKQTKLKERLDTGEINAQKANTTKLLVITLYIFLFPFIQY